ncbi:O-antigen ligase domain-containing protein [Komagataeibacter xylinus]|uniref:O-antigen ligase domain-containing protein n=2 Tax=Komagataeibacter xylinus TaxID=28448 RepID=A0A857FV15_KOMXY|nr:O-antigen ligase domain-containing protein [Komagataeibacter xylinus]
MHKLEQWMRWIATGLVIPMPLLLLYALAPAEIVMTTVAVLFVAHCVLRRDGGWLRQGWVAAAGLLWAQIVLASLLAGQGVTQAVMFMRYFVFVAALQNWVLSDPRTRRMLAWAYGAVAVWLVAGCWQQYLCGRNFMGYGRWEDGALLGPLWAPRAGQALVMTALPGLFPQVIDLARREGARGRVMAGALLLGLVVTMVLIAQRMPLLRLLLAMGLCSLLVPRLRAVAGAAVVAGAGAVALSPLLAPQAYHKLVLNFVTHMQGFADSPYGMLFIRAGVMIERHPWFGLGFDGFRHACPDPAYFHGLPWLGVSEGVHGAAVGCNMHPHNFYLLMGTMGGVPAMVLFAAFAACVLARAWRGLAAATATRDPQRLMLAVACVVVLWPLQSTSSFLTQPTGGWLFMILGWALACVPPASHLQSVRDRD